MNFKILLLGLLAPTFAISAAAEKSEYWTRDIEAGAVFTSGNTDQESFKLRFDATHDKNQYINAFHADTFQASQDGDDTADKFYLSYRLDFRFDDEHGVFGRLAYEDDSFSGFDKQIDLNFGYNQTLFSGDSVTIKGDAGAGAKYSQLETGESNTEPTVNLGGNLEWVISDNATFSQSLVFEIAKDLTTIRSETALTANIIDALALKMAVQIKNNSDVISGKEKTDTESTLTLVYSF